MPNVSHLLSVAALATGLGSDGSLDAVRRAQHQLQARTWTQVLRIENADPRSPYPQVVNALIFQLDSVLWFYTPVDGTQSLSLYRGRLNSDKANLGPLLAAIDRGFVRWEVLPEGGELPTEQRRLPNGCFIESMALLFRELERGASLENPRLLSYYVALPGGVRGHTVLQFTAGSRIQVIDPDRPTRVIRIHYANENDPRSVADRIRGDIGKARHLPLGEFLVRVSGRTCATVSAPAPRSHDPAFPAPSDAPRNTRS